MIMQGSYLTKKEVDSGRKCISAFEGNDFY